MKECTVGLVSNNERGYNNDICRHKMTILKVTVNKTRHRDQAHEH
jgi:hypothetical protein